MWATLVAFVGAAIAGVVLLLGDGEEEPFAGPSPETPGGVDRREVQERATLGDVRFLLTGVDCGFANVISPDERIAAEGVFCTVDFDMANRGSEAVVLDLSCQALVGADGASFTPHRQATLLIEESRAAFRGGVEPGQSLEDVAMVYDVPEGADPAAVELHVACDDEGRRIDLPAEL